jgi:hypothetical protein
MGPGPNERALLVAVEKYWLNFAIDINIKNNEN